MTTFLKWLPVACAAASSAATLGLCAVALTAGDPGLSVAAALCGCTSGLLWLMCD